MNYFIKKDNVIEKYRITYDKKELRELRREIIDNCSEIYHRDIKRALIDASDKSKIRNYMVLDYLGSIDREYEDEKIYHQTYDEYVYPNIVTIIDKLLKDDLSSISGIYYINEKNIDVESKIDRLNNEIDDLSNYSVDKKIEKLKELKELIDHKVINNNRKSVLPYYDKLKSLLKTDLVAFMRITDIEKISNFFDTDTEDVLKLAQIKK